MKRRTFWASNFGPCNACGATLASGSLNTRTPAMTRHNAQEDDLTVNLLELVLTRPVEERQNFLETACKGDSELYHRVWSYLQAEERMNGFLLDPLFSVAEMEHPFEPDQLLEQRFRIQREVAQGGMGIVYE